MKTKETLLMVAIVAILGLFATYNNCGMQLPEQALKQNTSSSTQAEGSLVTDAWIQPSAGTASMKPEVVFVMDTSGSMTPKVTALSNSIENWLAQLATLNIDELCLGVIKAETSPLSAGKLVAKPGNELCYCTFGENAASVTQAITGFRENLDHALVATAGSANKEAGIYSMQKALMDPFLVQNHQAAGCFRDDTSLVPVLVGDENDISAAMDRADAGFVFDNDAMIGQGNVFSSTPGDALYHSSHFDSLYSEASYRREYYTRSLNGGPYITDADGRYVNQIDHSTLAQAVKDFNQAFPSFGTSIGFYVDRLPANPSHGTPYWGGQQFAEEFNSPMIDMFDALDADSTAFQEEMNQMADSLASSLQYFYTFDLSQPICDQNQDGQVSDESVRVTVNGQSVDKAQYSIVQANRLVFNVGFAWSPEDKVEVVYTVCTP